MMTRRQAIKSTALATAVAAAAPTAFTQTPPLASGQPLITSSHYPYTLPPLPYALDALEPHLDARTMEIHHGRHHKAYVDNLNKAVAEFPDIAKETVEGLLLNLNTSVPEKIRTAVRNHGGGHYNHSLFWQMMKKDGGEPRTELAAAIERSFGNFTDFKAKFAEAATKVFGSGWAWLVLHEGKLAIESAPNQDSLVTPNPEMARMANRMALKLPDARIPTSAVLLGLDVWEHAYYLKYQNKRADYIAAWWNVVNWDFVAERYAKLAK